MKYRFANAHANIYSGPPLMACACQYDTIRGARAERQAFDRASDRETVSRSHGDVLAESAPRAQSDGRLVRGIARRRERERQRQRPSCWTERAPAGARTRARGAPARPEAGSGHARGARGSFPRISARRPVPPARRWHLADASQRVVYHCSLQQRPHSMHARMWSARQRCAGTLPCVRDWRLVGTSAFASCRNP